MKRSVGFSAFATLAAATLALSVSSAAFAGVDAGAAEALAKKSGCFKCHAIDKDKKGPSYKKVAEKLKGKPDGMDKCIKQITTGPKVKFPDGSEDDHKIIDTKDDGELKNICGWILSQ
jgi:cytochrome c